MTKNKQTNKNEKARKKKRRINNIVGSENIS